MSNAITVLFEGGDRDGMNATVMLNLNPEEINFTGYTFSHYTPSGVVYKAAGE